MYALVILLTEPKQLTVVPMSWFASLDIVQIFNRGVSHTKKHRLFFSPNQNDEPNFKLPVQNHFDHDIAANYEGKVLSVWATFDDAEKHMNSRRHLLPAIYNANMERFHWHLDGEQNNDHVKEEPVEGLIWLNDTETIDLLEGDELIEDGVEGVAGIANHVVNNELIDAGVEGVVDVKPLIVFPHFPDIIFDISENDEMIRNVIAFSGNDVEQVMDCQLQWVGEFPQPHVLKTENPNDGVLMRNDKLLGSLKFTIDAEATHRMIEIDGKFVRMSNELYILLLGLNDRESYKLHYFDAKFVLIVVASYIRKNEVLNNGIDKDDPRIQLIREIFRHRVLNDATRMQWFEKRIDDISNWLTAQN